MTLCVGEHMPADTTRGGEKRACCFFVSTRYVRSAAEMTH